MRKTTCCVCNKNPNASNKRMCMSCHSAYMREWRKTHPLTEKQTHFARVRKASQMAEKRGRLKKVPCQCCNNPQSERHHPEPLNPKKVIYLCKSHHILFHQGIISLVGIIPQTY